MVNKIIQNLTVAFIPSIVTNIF